MLSKFLIGLIVLMEKLLKVKELGKVLDGLPQILK